VCGRLRIGVIPTILPCWIAPRIPDFQKAFPEVDVQLVEDSTARLVEKLQSGDLDIAVASLPVKNPDIICSELFREPLFLAVSKGHPLADKSAVDLRAFVDEPLLLLKEGHCLRDNVLMACTKSKAELRSIFESNQLESIFQLIRAGFGVTLMPAMASTHGAGCTLIPLKGSHNSFEGISYQAGRLSSCSPTRHHPADARADFLATFRSPLSRVIHTPRSTISQ
jgi:LysR family transcriptional regulator, hydrogen peroxide-inducible genes activator